MSEEQKNKKNCSNKKNIMFVYGFLQLGSSILSSLALITIAIGFCTLKNESKLHNQCVDESIANGNSLSYAVHYCNGGN